MRIRVDNPALLGDLLDYLSSNDCVALQTGSNIVSVSLADELPYDVARVALDLHMADWLVGRGAASAVVID